MFLTLTLFCFPDSLCFCVCTLCVWLTLFSPSSPAHQFSHSLFPAIHLASHSWSVKQHSQDPRGISDTHAFPFTHTQDTGYMDWQSRMPCPTHSLVSCIMMRGCRGCNECNFSYGNTEAWGGGEGKRANLSLEKRREEKHQQCFATQNLCNDYATTFCSFQSFLPDSDSLFWCINPWLGHHFKLFFHRPFYLSKEKSFLLKGKKVFFGWQKCFNCIGFPLHW